jgi:hypothetical protein
MKRMKDEIPDRVRDDNKLQIPPNPPFSKGEIKYGDRGECISAMPAGIKLGDRGECISAMPAGIKLGDRGWGAASECLS